MKKENFLDCLQFLANNYIPVFEIIDENNFQDTKKQTERPSRSALILFPIPPPYIPPF